MRNKNNVLVFCSLVGLTFGCAVSETKQSQTSVTAVKDAAQAVQKEQEIEISSADFRRAIQKSVKSMFQSGVLDKADGGRYIVAVSYIADTTKKGFDMASVKQNLAAALAAGRKVRVVSMASKSTPPQITVAGRITQRTAFVRGGKKRQEYYLHLVLTDAKSGMKLWENTTPVVKKAINSNSAKSN